MLFNKDKSPIEHFASSQGDEAPVMLNKSEMNVISLLRQIEYGELVVNIAKHTIMKIEPKASYRPSDKLALELLQEEENKYNTNKYESRNTTNA